MTQLRVRRLYTMRVIYLPSQAVVDIWRCQRRESLSPRTGCPEGEADMIYLLELDELPPSALGLVEDFEVVKRHLKWDDLDGGDCASLRALVIVSLDLGARRSVLMRQRLQHLALEPPLILVTRAHASNLRHIGLWPVKALVPLEYVDDLLPEAVIDVAGRTAAAASLPAHVPKTLGRTLSAAVRLSLTYWPPVRHVSHLAVLLACVPSTLSHAWSRAAPGTSAGFAEFLECVWLLRVAACAPVEGSWSRSLDIPGVDVQAIERAVKRRFGTRSPAQALVLESCHRAAVAMLASRHVNHGPTADRRSEE